MQLKCWLSLAAFAIIPLIAHAESWIRINQLGYLPETKKVAVLMSEEEITLQECSLVDLFTGKTVYTTASIASTGAFGSMKSSFRINFSEFNVPGTYYLKAGNTCSPHFPINSSVYNGTADFLLNYMRQQRCGYNPYLKDSCHLNDGYILYHPTKSGQYTDVRGGWHDAADYLQYTTTSANAIYQMMFAYQQNPEAFTDHYQANGLPGANGIPDIVDEIKWGLDWLNRMNPREGEFYNQIADDRDHAGMRLPNDDHVDYGYGAGKGRPVYFCSGEKQIRGEYQNATTGVASTTGKFASCFAAGARLLEKFYPEFAKEIGAKADNAYREGIRKPGACQTASVNSPYIYEEDNWTDDMELAAMELYQSTGEEAYFRQAVEYGRREPFTPWMGADSARHYQWYPFMNMGHYWLATSGKDKRINNEFIRNMHTGIQRTYEKARTHPFFFGIPTIWCSNNLVTAMLTQCRLYRETTGDTSYEEMEASLRDWLFGCNPWGSSMVVELPLHGDYPLQPHSAYFYCHKGNATGGLVDGPVYQSIFQSLRGVNLATGEAYERFQPGSMVYHDSTNDYSTNEPTMDGTASLTYYLSSLQKEGMQQAGRNKDRNIYREGGIIRTDPSKKQLTLLFTADDKADGAEVILRILGKYSIQGGFFFTGLFHELYPEVVDKLLKAGHYVGSHSQGHLLYCPWENRDSLLVSRDEFEKDMLKSYETLRKAGIETKDAPIYVPPYEYYNKKIAAWSEAMGIHLVNFTPGSGSNADYTTPDMHNYRSSEAIYEKIMQLEATEGLNGHLLLLHLGTSDLRTDKFYTGHLEKLIKTLRKKGYTFAPLREAVGM